MLGLKRHLPHRQTKSQHNNNNLEFWLKKLNKENLRPTKMYKNILTYSCFRHVIVMLKDENQTILKTCDFSCLLDLKSKGQRHYANL